jgi:ankyrin repeat protein
MNHDQLVRATRTVMGYQLLDAIGVQDTGRCKDLIAQGADLTLNIPASNDSLRALEYSVRFNLLDVVEALLLAGASIEANPVYHHDPIRAHLLRPFTFAALLGRWEAHEMIARVADPALRSTWLAQDMREAATQGWHEWIPRLLALGADPLHRSAEGNTPLNFAVIGGNVEVIDLLLAAGATWEGTPNADGQTAGDLLRANRHDLAARYGLAPSGTVVRLADRLRQRPAGS